MAASPTCTLTGSSSGGPFATTNGINMTAGETGTITLTSQSGVSTWSISVYGLDDVTAAPTLTVNSVAKTATFLVPATSGGAAVLFQSVVNGGLTNGVVDPTLTTTFGAYVLGTNLNRVIAYNQTTEGGAVTGWSGPINTAIRNGAGGSGLLGGNLTWAATVGAPTLSQNSTSGASGQALMVQAQGAVTTGGALNLASGAGATAGDVNIQCGGTTMLKVTTNAGLGQIIVRQVAGAAGHRMLYWDGVNVQLSVDGDPILFGAPLVNLGGGAGATLGTIGGSGPATAAQNKWMPWKDSSGVAMWIPIWK